MSTDHAHEAARTTTSGDSYDNLEPALRELAGLAPDDPARARLRAEIIARALPLGEHIASRYNARGVEREDLVQIAACGVVLAVDRFDPALGSPFLGFAIPTVMGEVKRYFRDSTWAVRVPRRIKEVRQQVAAAIPELAQRLDREPTARELAAHLDTDLHEITQALLANNGYAAQSLDARTPTDDGDATPAIPADALTVIEDGYALMEDSITIGPLLSALSAQERAILQMRFGRDLTQVQIGKALGISQMQVSRILARTLTTLRAQALNEEHATQIA
ncbi:SigB/SigF/SigG family RNA polymerase sigma factor [Nocardia sp. NPDC005978]|uniref:SigB/SigF/SigG family RNA polymerase sigma factor n=1 Tax=Nocardia sp. NPDC005978 TaxID=3156725 RepID=UPI0033BF7CF2